MNKFRCSFGNSMSRDRIEEMCCLYALGELPPEETLRMQGHLRECEQCRKLVEEFERIMLFDLPSIEVMHSEGSIPDDPESVNASELMERIRERARSASEQGREQSPWEDGPHPSPSVMRPMYAFRVAGFTALAAGWLIAAVLLLIHTGKKPEGRRVVSVARQPENRDGESIKIVNHALQTSNANIHALENKLDTISERARIDRFELARLRAQYQALNGSDSDLHARFAKEEGLLEQETAELQLTRDSLKAQSAAKNSLEVQLSDVYSRFDKQRQEVATLRRIAATTPTAYPVSENRVSQGEAREILGARDLHIVDVYDVDNSHNAARTYGRIYYVNHRLLIFYAFDLSKLEKNHKVVAFQAWGFRQPQMSTVESLGLFYLDNATLNRWALRVSNPEILSRIDTLFVTVEPPGGSSFPKGRRLLMATLAGPPNHP